MKKIRVITAFPNGPDLVLRKLEDLLPYQTPGIEISLAHNIMGTIHGQSDVEHEFAKPGLAQRAIEAEEDGMDAIVIESMGDTALGACREVVRIPVIGMSDTAMRVSCMLGRNFGIITAGNWHGYALEKLAKLYGVHQYMVGFEALNLQPFFVDETSNEGLKNKLLNAAINLIENKGADVILCGGSYFIGCGKELQMRLLDKNYEVPVVDPLPLSIYFAQTLAQAGVSHSKKIYAQPQHATKIIGYPDFKSTPGVSNS